MVSLITTKPDAKYEATPFLILVLDAKRWRFRGAHLCIIRPGSADTPADVILLERWETVDNTVRFVWLGNRNRVSLTTTLAAGAAVFTFSDWFFTKANELICNFSSDFFKDDISRNAI